MRQLHVDEFGVHVFNIGQHQQLFDCGIVAHVAVHLGVGVTPLFGGLAEQGYIEHVRFVGVDDDGLRGGHCGGYQVRFNGVGVDMVVELGQGAIQIPCKR